MYTVKELIDFLKQCPEDYKVYLCHNGIVSEIAEAGIDHSEEDVTLFAE